MLNLHHLELFYYVAKFKGINEAARKMPRRLQPPTISTQVKALEECLATRLFERQPFQLTPDGVWLYALACRLLEPLETVANQLPSRCIQRVRVGASEVVLYEYLPPIIAAVRRLCPDIAVSLQDGNAAQLLDAAAAGELDLTVVATNRPIPPGLGCLPLVSLPLVLLVPRALRIASVEHFWRQPAIAERLIVASGAGTLCRLWEEGLQRRGVHWPATIDVQALIVLKRYVAENAGVGVTLDLPTLARDPKIRALPLPEFGRCEIKLVWREPASPHLATLLAAIKARAQELWPDPPAETPATLRRR